MRLHTKSASGLLSFEEAFARITDVSALTGTETVALEDAYARVLADDITAQHTHPPFAVSAMDGYAVCARDTVDAQGTGLVVTASIAAGDPPGAQIRGGETARIFTGAPVPAGADAILIQENAVVHANGTISPSQPVETGSHIRPAGYDFSAGDLVLRRGVLLNSAGVSLAAAAGHVALTVRRKPRVGLLSTGNELVAPGSLPAPGQIIASNAVGLAALVSHFGGVPVNLGIARDTKDALNQAIDLAFDAGLDLLVTLGGASVGDHDLVKPTFESRGAKMDVWRVAVRPGKPLMHGRLNSMQLLGLPGNPVSSLVCAHLFLQPLIAAFLGRNGILPTIEAILGAPLPTNGTRRHFMRATIHGNQEGVPVVYPIAEQDSSLLTRLAVADCLINVPPRNSQMPAGSRCEIIKTR